MVKGLVTLFAALVVAAAGLLGAHGSVSATSYRSVSFQNCGPGNPGVQCTTLSAYWGYNYSVIQGVSYNCTNLAGGSSPATGIVDGFYFTNGQSYGNVWCHWNNNNDWSNIQIDAWGNSVSSGN